MEFQDEFGDLMEKRSAFIKEKEDIDSKAILVLNQLETMVGLLCFGNGVLATIFGIYFQISCESVVPTFTGLLFLYFICLALPIPLALYKLHILVEHTKIVAYRDGKVTKSLDNLIKKVKADEKAREVKGEEGLITPISKEKLLSKKIELYLEKAPPVDSQAFKQKFIKIICIVGCFVFFYFLFLALFLVRGRQNHCDSEKAAAEAAAKAAAKAAAEAAAKAAPKCSPKAAAPPKTYHKLPKYCYYYGCF